ncbi:hypothetical protein CYMTET_15139 [Cymbomonas tetramitiformis]|uniref:Uncharacterized protein n=1 Tax=Cymbomonas tetramitiformis TaxID=36881 RepID=A0AAE0GEZ5_9CHLO|nr:hypothetical protein CYMTET_15139 [Cymbomonas tetramitiformis]
MPATVAAAWLLPMMPSLEPKKRNEPPDLLGQDFLVLGHLLLTLATFVEASGAVGAATPLMAGELLKLLQVDRIARHKEAFVRRCVICAAGKVLAALAPSTLQVLLVDGDTAIKSGVEWIERCIGEMARHDTDEECRILAIGCLQLLASLAQNSFARLSSVDDSMHSSLNRMLTL